MPSSPFYVFDANVIVSALLLPGSVPRRAFDKARDHGRILLSESIINELDDVLRRPQFDKYVYEEERIHFLVALLQEAHVLRVTRAVNDCRDPKDNRYLELALEGQASCIVTGDTDLRDLNPYHGIAVLTPRQFLDAF